jgi:Cu/Ag efflux protein CusF
MLYVLGINDSYQRCPSKELELFIRDLIQENNITALAEEYSEQACRLNTKTGKSELKILSKKVGLHDYYLDPTEPERMDMKIRIRDQIKEDLGLKGRAIIEGSSEDKLIKQEQKKYWAIREKEWLRRIKELSLLNGNTLVLIGNDHIPSFSKLLSENDLDYKIIETSRFKDVITC